MRLSDVTDDVSDRVTYGRSIDWLFMRRLTSLPVKLKMLNVINSNQQLRQLL